MRDERNRRYASYPDIDVAERHAITVRKAIERAHGRHYNDLQREAEYDLFFDFWYNHWPRDFWHNLFPDDIYGTSAESETWFESKLTDWPDDVNGKPVVDFASWYKRWFYF